VGAKPYKAAESRDAGDLNERHSCSYSDKGSWSLGASVVNFRNFYIAWLIVSLRAAVGSFDWESGDDHVMHETYKC
jgi:hypothetical protein